MGHNRHLSEFPQRIIVRILKMVKATQIKMTKFLRRNQIHPQAIGATKTDSYIAGQIITLHGLEKK